MWSQFASFIFISVIGLKLRSPGFCCFASSLYSLLSTDERKHMILIFLGLTCSIVINNSLKFHHFSTNDIIPFFFITIILYYMTIFINLVYIIFLMQLDRLETVPFRGLRS